MTFRSDALFNCSVQVVNNLPETNHNYNIKINIPHLTLHEHAIQEVDINSINTLFKASEKLANSIHTRINSYHLCQFLLCKNMIVPFTDPRSTYNGNEETIEQANEYNGHNCNIGQV